MTSHKRSINIIGVRIDPVGPVRYLNPGPVDVVVGDHVIVETADGRVKGEVVIESAQILYSELSETQGAILSKVEKI